MDQTFEKNLEIEDKFAEEKRHNFDFRLKRDLNAMTVPPRAQKAKLDMIPQDIQKLTVFQKFPEFPFGLTGPGGCGKSCAFAWLVKRFLINEYIALGPSYFVHKADGMFQGVSIQEEPVRTSLLWLNWPSVAITMKHLAARREWDKQEASLLSIIERIRVAPATTILFIDDFGMENIKGEKSYCQEQLELLIDVAYGCEVRTFWTTNKTVEELGEERLYGYRMMSRMAGLSPDVKLPVNLPDLRIRSAYA